VLAHSFLRAGSLAAIATWSLAGALDPMVPRPLVGVQPRVARLRERLVNPPTFRKWRTVSHPPSQRSRRKISGRRTDVGRTL